jgi:hypothetical protein
MVSRGPPPGCCKATPPGPPATSADTSICCDLPAGGWGWVGGGQKGAGPEPSRSVRGWGGLGRCLQAFGCGAWVPASASPAVKPTGARPPPTAAPQGAGAQGQAPGPWPWGQRSPTPAAAAGPQRARAPHRHAHQQALRCTALRCAALHCAALHCTGAALHWRCTGAALRCAGAALNWSCAALHWRRAALTRRQRALQRAQLQPGGAQRLVVVPRDARAPGPAPRPRRRHEEPGCLHGADLQRRTAVRGGFRGWGGVGVGWGAAAAWSWGPAGLRRALLAWLPLRGQGLVQAVEVCERSRVCVCVCVGGGGASCAHVGQRDVLRL